MKCVINLFKFTVGDWVKISDPQKPGKMKLFKVVAENHFHKPHQPSSFDCGCNYKLASKTNLISGKKDRFTLSSHPVKTIQWRVHLDSENPNQRLGNCKVKVLKPDQADLIDEAVLSKKTK